MFYFTQAIDASKRTEHIRHRLGKRERNLNEKRSWKRYGRDERLEEGEGVENEDGGGRYGDSHNIRSTSSALKTS